MSQPLQTIVVQALGAQFCQKLSLGDFALDLIEGGLKRLGSATGTTKQMKPIGRVPLAKGVREPLPEAQLALGDLLTASPAFRAAVMTISTSVRAERCELGLEVLVTRKPARGDQP